MKEMTEDTEKMLTNLVRVIRTLKRGSVYDISLQYCKTFDKEYKDEKGKLTQLWYETYRKISYVLKVS